MESIVFFKNHYKCAPISLKDILEASMQLLLVYLEINILHKSDISFKNSRELHVAL